MKRERIPGAALRASAAAAGLAVLAACGGGGGSATPSATAAPCTSGTGATFTLVSPPNGGSGVGSTSAGQASIVVKTSTAIPGTIELQLVDTTNGSSQTGGQITGPVGGPYTSTGFTFAAGQAYTVYYLNTAQTGCAGVAVGSFST